jgi:hypothetical protein
MNTAPMRAFLGMVAGVVAVLVFQQGVWAVLHAAGQMMLAPYPIRPMPPLGVPWIVDLCFWGGVYGAAYAVLLPRLHAPFWVRGLGAGFVALLIGWFVVAPLKGMPAANGWAGAAMLHAVLLNEAWGIGVALILPLLTPRLAIRA